MITRVKVFDFDFISAYGNQEFLDELFNYRQHLKENQLPLVITPNVDHLVRFQEANHQSLKKRVATSQFILPDGQPIVWASKLMGKPLKSRLTSSDLFPLLWTKIKNHRKKLFTIVSDDVLGEGLQREYTNITYITPPFFDLEKDKSVLEQLVNKSVAIIKDFQPEFVVVGIGFPKQETVSLLIHEQLKLQGIPSPLFLCIGASIEFYLKIKPRAPIFLQKVGLEWLHRLTSEPRRLWKRYLIGAFRFTTLCAREWSKSSNTHSRGK